MWSYKHLSRKRITLPTATKHAKYNAPSNSKLMFLYLIDVDWNIKLNFNLLVCQ